MNPQIALAIVIETALRAAPNDQQVLEAVATAAASTLPEISQAAALRATLLREADRKQLTLFQLLEATTHRQ